MITPLWIIQPWYLTNLEMLEDYPHLILTRSDLVVIPTSELASCMAYHREYLTLQGISAKASDLPWSP